jgi:hypothetical protein
LPAINSALIGAFSFYRYNKGMEIKTLKIGEENIAELISDKIELSKAQDAVDLMGNCFNSKTKKLIIHEKNLIPSFFDLKTGIAGEILQKFVNYNFKIAIIGDFSKYQSSVLKDFIYESNKQGEINFVKSIEEAKEKLSR